MKILEVLPESLLGLGLGKFQWEFWESPDEVGTSYNSSVCSVYGYLSGALASPYPSGTWKVVCKTQVRALAVTPLRLSLVRKGQHPCPAAILRRWRGRPGQALEAG